MTSPLEITGRLRNWGMEDEKKPVTKRQEKVPRERSSRGKGPEAGRTWVWTQEHKGQCSWAECPWGGRSAARGGWSGTHLKAVLVSGHFQPRLSQK